MPRRPRRAERGVARTVVLDFLKRGSDGAASGVPQPGQPATFADHTAGMSFRAKSGERVRIAGRPDPAEVLPPLLAGVARSEVEIVAPRAVEFRDATPALQRPEEASLWLRAHEADGPVARHAILVLESTAAADLAVDGLVCALLHGDLDASGYPEEDSVVGGYASRWDEDTGDLVARSVVAWGGSGLRGDTDRHALQMIGQLHARLVTRAEGDHVTGADEHDETAREAHRCPHCGFELASARSLFCEKCGMRLKQG